MKSAKDAGKILPVVFLLANREFIRTLVNMSSFGHDL